MLAGLVSASIGATAMTTRDLEPGIVTDLTVRLTYAGYLRLDKRDPDLVAVFKTVERTIGCKMGTGGSSGVSFLKRALDHTFFPELIDVRTVIGAK